MQIALDGQKTLLPDPTVIPLTFKMTHLSLQLDGKRYALIKRIGRAYERTNKDILIDFIDMWLEHNVESFPEEEREAILEMINERKSDHAIGHRRP